MEAKSTGSIGVGITTRNRRDVFGNSYAKWMQYLPPNAKIVVIDDASEIPCPYADMRFEQQQGIARAKNAAMSLLMDCEHLFIVDDDVWPVSKDWYRPYVNSGQNHMCLSFELNSKGQRLSNSVYKVGGSANIELYNAPNGCMLYVKKAVIEKVGGMDPVYGLWGYEHVDWSQRIHASGFTQHPFMDVDNSLDLFHVSDYFGAVESSVPVQERINHAQRNKEIYESRIGQNIYVPLI